jgi:hypothetical protein
VHACGSFRFCAKPEALKFCAKWLPILAVKCALTIFFCAERGLERFDICSRGVFKQASMLKLIGERLRVSRRCLDQQLRRA